MCGPKNSSWFFVALLLAMLGASAAMANPIPCVNGSLALYAPLTSSSPNIACQYQDLIFTFAYQELQYQPDPSQPPLASGDRIENHVNIAFINPAPGQEGLMLSPTDYSWEGLNGNSSDVNFSYAVNVATPGKSIQGSTFDVTATITGLAGILAGETICCPNGTSAIPTSTTLTVNQFSTGTGTDSAPYDRPATSVTINKDLLIASIAAGDQAYLNSFDQTFDLGSVPEPGVLVLTGGGLLGLALLSRRKAAGKGLGVILLFCLASAGAHASPLCTSLGSSLNLFLNQTCTIGTVSFTFGSAATAYNYVFSGGPGLGNPITASQVNVTVLQSSTDPGFQFVGQWAASGAQTGSLTLQFSASAPTQVGSASFTTTTSKSGAGSLSGSSTVTNGVPPVGYTFPSGGVPIPVVPPLTNVTLVANVNVNGNGTSSPASLLRDNAHLSNLVMTVHENLVPEPVTAIFLGSGLIGLALIGRKRASNKK